MKFCGDAVPGVGPWLPITSPPDRPKLNSPAPTISGKTKIQNEKRGISGSEKLKFHVKHLVTLHLDSAGAWTLQRLPRGDSVETTRQLPIQKYSQDVLFAVETVQLAFMPMWSRYLSRTRRVVRRELRRSC